ncbi:MAG TPA: hypothetical protein VGO29_05710 [Solirubrobacteraceae bacterium]|jgi:hypothetical protein|nr:hypothetical protein [Solirubrobacteraceae bacterium]
MLFIFIAIAWLAVLSLIAAVCRVAAEGDAKPDALARPQAELIGVRLALSRAPSTPPARPRRWRTVGGRAQPHVAARTRRLAARDLRQR